MKVVKFPDGTYAIRRMFLWFPNRYLDFTYTERNRFNTLSDPDVRTNNIELVKQRLLKMKEKNSKGTVIDFKKEYLVQSIINKETKDDSEY